MGWVWYMAGAWLVASAFFGRAWRRRRVQKRLHAGLRGTDHAVTIVGTIIDSARLVESPLSGKKGVVVIATAELPEFDHESLPVELKTTVAVPFYIDSIANGIVRVEGTAFDTPMRGVAPKPRDRKREEAFMVANGRGATAALAATFREVVLAPGMRVAVHGAKLVEEDHHAERGYRENAPLRTKLVAPEGQRLAIGEPPPP
ncbi:MAG TPA: hypothetical protein VGM90_15895 [Kofleriaceae bacterium]|jgi:hypothetical protein